MRLSQLFGSARSASALLFLALLGAFTSPRSSAQTSDGDCSGWGANEVSIETGASGTYVTVYDMSGNALVPTELGKSDPSPGDDPNPSPESPVVFDTLYVAPQEGCDLFLDFGTDGGGLGAVRYPHVPVVIEVATVDEDPDARIYTRYAYAAPGNASVSFFYPNGTQTPGPDVRLVLDEQTGEVRARPDNSDTYANDELGDESWVMPYNWDWLCGQPGVTCNAASSAFLAPVPAVPSSTVGPVFSFATGADVTIASGVSTTWDVPNATLRFAQNRRLLVRGLLAAADLTFTAQNTSQKWAGIVAAGSSGLVTLSDGAVVEYATAGVTVYDPARVEISDAETSLTSNTTGIKVLSAGGASHPGALVEDAQITGNGTGIFTDYNCTWNSGASPICYAEEVQPTRSQLTIVGANISDNTGSGVYALNTDATSASTCVSGNGGNGFSIANALVDPFRFNALIENGAGSDGNGASVLTGGNLQLSPTTNVGGNRIASNQEAELFVTTGGTAFAGFGGSSGQNAIVDTGGGVLVYAPDSTTINARYNWWGASPPPSGAFGGPGTVDRASYLSSNPTSDVCSASFGGGDAPFSVAGTPPEGTREGGVGFVPEELGAEIRRLRMALVADPGSEGAASLVRNLFTMQRLDREDVLGERLATMQVLASLREHLVGIESPTPLRGAGEAALEAEAADLLEREAYAEARTLLDIYRDRVSGAEVRRALRLTTAFLEGLT